MDDRVLAGIAGRIESINLLTAIALAMASQNSENPRGTLADVVAGVEEELRDAIAKLEGLSDAQREIAAHCAQTNAMHVGRMADSFLKGLGAGPAKD